MTDVVHFELSVGCNAHFRDAFKPIIRQCLEGEADFSVANTLQDVYTLSTLTVASCWVENLCAVLANLDKGLAKAAKSNPGHRGPLVKTFALKLGCKSRSPLATVAAALAAEGGATFEFAPLGEHGEDDAFEDKHVLFIEGAALEDLKAAVAALAPEATD